jgi:poly(A) polymerase
MSIKAQIAPHIIETVEQLQIAGYETYIVGGAVRDGMLNRVPKDYDISTSATPRQICKVFGHKRTFVVGRRFRLVHLHHGKEVIEISTFRQAPNKNKQDIRPRRTQPPENMIFHDNEFGTSEEDAWRRDFTVNAIFYDPVKDELIDYTGMGVDDINNCRVRVIGDPDLRFEEDPVRLLRALKLVGQYGFELEEETKESLINAYSADIFRAFREYGLLKFYLPFLDSRWDTEAGKYAIDLLAEKNKRQRDGLYRDSMSLAIAAVALPFVEEYIGNEEPGNLWENYKGIGGEVKKIILRVFNPHTMIRRLTASALKMLLMQPSFKYSRKPGTLFSNRSYPNGRELMIIQNEVNWQIPGMLDKWPYRKASSGRRKASHRQGGKKDFRRRR